MNLKEEIKKHEKRIKEGKMKSDGWWYMDKKQRLFISTGMCGVHIKKGDGDDFSRRWYHKIDHKRTFISIEEQKKMGLKRITRKVAIRLTKLNDMPIVKDFVRWINK